MPGLSWSKSSPPTDVVLKRERLEREVGINDTRAGRQTSIYAFGDLEMTGSVFPRRSRAPFMEGVTLGNDTDSLGVLNPSESNVVN